MLLVLAILVAGVFLLPKLLDNGPPQETVPALAGMTQTEAERALTDAGLRLGQVSEDTSPDVPKGQVMAQDPDAGEQVDENTRIDITVSQGKPQQEVPDLIGSNKDSAADQLKSLGLKVRLEQKESDEPKDDVVEMDPSPGSKVADGSTVTLFFSDGPESVPDVVGKTEDQARKPDPGRRVRGQRGARLDHRGQEGHRPRPEPQGRQQGGPGPHGDDRGLVVRAAARRRPRRPRRRAPPGRRRRTLAVADDALTGGLAGQLAVSGRA